MQQLPFNIPRSLSSYTERFEDEPKEVIAKLKRHLKKRGPDAVGHFLLAWFYHLQNEQQKAVKEALKAKTYAPGSPLMEHLHYFLVHPEKFEAAIPEHTYSSSQLQLKHGSRISPILDLDKLIELLEAAESKRIQIPENEEEADDTDLSKQAEDVDDLVSETLANIHAQQGRRKEAIKMYEQLILKKPNREDVYREAIKKLKEKSEKG